MGCAWILHSMTVGVSHAAHTASMAHETSSFRHPTEMRHFIKSLLPFRSQDVPDEDSNGKI